MRSWALEKVENREIVRTPQDNPDEAVRIKNPFGLVNELNRTILVESRQNVETIVDYYFGEINVFGSMLTRFRTQVHGPVVLWNDQETLVLLDMTVCYSDGQAQTSERKRWYSIWGESCKEGRGITETQGGGEREAGWVEAWGRDTGTE